MKRLALELGGNGPFVVLDDADIERAVEAAVFGNYWHQGQICMITNRLIVDSRVYKEFVDAIRRPGRRVARPATRGPETHRASHQRPTDTVHDKIAGANSKALGSLSGAT